MEMEPYVATQEIAMLRVACNLQGMNKWSLLCIYQSSHSSALFRGEAQAS